MTETSPTYLCMMVGLTGAPWNEGTIHQILSSRACLLGISQQSDRQETALRKEKRTSTPAPALPPCRPKSLPSWKIRQPPAVSFVPLATSRPCPPRWHASEPKMPPQARIRPLGSLNFLENQASTTFDAVAVSRAYVSRGGR
jgi:hypothetical protein